MRMDIRTKSNHCQELIVPAGYVTISSMDRDERESVRVAFAKRLNRALDSRRVPEAGKGRQQYVARMFGVSQKGARKWLVGEAMPDTTRLCEIAETLRVSVQWLMCGVEEETESQPWPFEAVDYDRVAQLTAEDLETLEVGMIAVLAIIESKRLRRAKHKREPPKSTTPTQGQGRAARG